MHFFLVCEMLFLLSKLLKYEKMEKSAVILKSLQYFDSVSFPYLHVLVYVCFIS